MRRCVICGHEGPNTFLVVREMIRGTRHPFEYMECAACGCVQIVNPPSDMRLYYANDTYGSFVSPERRKLVTAIRRIRNRHAIEKKGGVVGALLNALKPVPSDYRAIGDYAGKEAKILDLGCGIGAYISDLFGIGYRNVEGVDPFIERDVLHPSGVRVRKLFIHEVTDVFDVIISHHSFEHVPDPLETLIAVRERLHPGGVCLLTVPVAEDLYRMYGTNCYLIQAPQHVVLPSIRGMSQLATKAGLVQEAIIRDPSSAVSWLQISELWKRDIAMNEVVGPMDGYFQRAELDAFRRQDAAWLEAGLGDNITFVLRKSALVGS